MVASAFFFSLEFTARSARATVITCCRLFHFFGLLLPCFIAHGPYAAIFLPTGLMPLSFPLLRAVVVRQTAVVFFVLLSPCNSSSLLRVDLSVQQVPVPHQHVCCSSCSLPFTFRSPCITFFRKNVVCFALGSAFFSFVFLLFSAFLSCLML